MNATLFPDPHEPAKSHLFVSGARVSSGKDSKQDYETPPDLLRAIVRKFGPIEVDLAATHENAVAPIFVTPEMDSLKCEWSQFSGKLCFLNPPFFDIEPWASKCAQSKLQILFLTPASVDSNWWDAHVHHRAYVKFLKPRLKFVGAKDPYPKACSISCYNFSERHWYEPWQWK